MTAATIDDPQESWLSGHLYYTQHLDLVVSGFVYPLVVSLANEGQITGFFFVRDGLGGPHIRLRLRVTPSAEEPAQRAMQEAAHRFLACHPFKNVQKEELIGRGNPSVFSTSPRENDDIGNSFQWIPFQPEIERYGGPSRFRLSLAFFTFSSVAAIEFLASHGSLPRAVLLARAFRLLLRQALGFASDEIELLDLLRYGVDSWGASMPKIIEKGDRIARSQAEILLQLFEDSQQEVRSLLADGFYSAAADLLVIGASRLSTAIQPADRATRARILGSQLHMTATRLGISNAEEAYLSCLLTTTLRKAREGGTELSWLSRKPGEVGIEQAAAALNDLLSPALTMLGGVPYIPSVT